MYEELVKRLRDRAKREDAYYEHSGDIISKAANTIEELATKLATLQDSCKWIPVTKMLPKTRESICGKKSSKVIVAFRFNDGTQGTDTAHTLNGEWVFEDHITVVARTITHWMPLPSAPTEE